MEDNHKEAVERNARLNKLREHFIEVYIENKDEEKSTDNNELLQGTWISCYEVEGGR